MMELKTQASTDSAPGSRVKVSGGQGAHAVAAVMLLYEVSLHWVQKGLPANAANDPASHAEQAELPGADE